MRLNNDKVLSLLGLARKAGKVVSGEYSVETALRSGKAHLVLISEDASENTKKKFQNKCAYYHTPICFYGKKEELGRCIGQELRSSVAVTDAGFCQALKQQLERECGQPQETPGI